MPYRDDPAEPDVEQHPQQQSRDESVLEAGEQRVRRLWECFFDFALKDNVLEVACGLMCALLPSTCSHLNLMSNRWPTTTA